MQSDARVSDDQYREIRETLLSSAATGFATRILRGEARDRRDGHSSGPGSPLHPGDDTGRVIAWLWRNEGPEATANFVSDLLAELRLHHPMRVEPLIRLDDLLGGLPMALGIEPRLTDSEIQEIVDTLRQEVPVFYGADPNG